MSYSVKYKYILYIFQQLLEAASLFKLSELKKEILEFLPTNINADNCFFRQKYAKEHGYYKLQREITSYIQKNAR